MQNDVPLCDARWRPTSATAKKDCDESRRVHRAIRARVKGCWHNAREAVKRLNEYADASYVEGWAVVGRGLPFEHGWVVRHGVIVDPTLLTEEMVYFPGLEYRGRQGIKDFLRLSEGRWQDKADPLFYTFGWGGRQSPSYMQAFRDAMALVKSLHPEAEWCTPGV